MSDNTRPPQDLADALALARHWGLDRLDAHLLLGHLLQQSRTWLLAHGDAPLPLALAQAFVETCRRLADGQPLAYLLGQREFHGLMLTVTPDVLVPRPDTETLVDWALALLPTLPTAHPRVLDLGTGSGAIAITLAKLRPQAQVTAVDASRQALAVAQQNAARLGTPNITFIESSWFSGLSESSRFELIVANPPYVAESDSHLNQGDVRFEPISALKAGLDGLDAIRHIAQTSPRFLQASGRWPLSEYFTAKWVPPEVLIEYPWNKQSAPTCLQENIDGMAEDDDLNYPLIALLTLETYGRDFNTDHIADQWLKLLPAGRVYTAERIVYRNLLDGIPPLEVGGLNNPFKEWIGALIRTDLYGWINPGNPKLAAQMAYRDAWLSHRRNGLFGAAMSAAMCAVAMVSKDVNEVIDAGLSVLPPASQIYQACEFARALGNSDIDYESALDKLYEYVAGMHWVHTVNNAASGVMALTRSKGDFSAAITLTVMGGWDTDSIGATVGSICGAMTGAQGIDPKWSIPIADRLASSIPGCDQLKLSELAIRTKALAI